MMGFFGSWPQTLCIDAPGNPRQVDVPTSRVLDGDDLDAHLLDCTC